MSINNLTLYHNGRRAGSLVLYRGDSYPIPFLAKDRETGRAMDLTGYSFLLTVSSEENPDGISGQVMEVSGQVSATVQGEVTFTPSTTDTDQDSGTYYYDIQAVDPGGSPRTVAKSMMVIQQDISKSVSSSSEYTTTFDNADLVAGVLTVSHNLGNSYPLITVWDDNNEQVGVTMIPVDDNSFQIDLGGAITGTWLISVRVPSWRYSTSFVDSDLVAGVLTVTHGLGTAYPSVAVYDGSNRLVGVTITSISTTQFSIDFAGTITGTWHLTAV